MLVDVIEISGRRFPAIDLGPNSPFESVNIISDLGNKMEVDVIYKPKITTEKELQAIKASSQLIVAERILNGTLPTERLDEFALTFDPPEINRTYKQTWILRDPVTDELFEVIKPEHTLLGICKMEDIPSEFKPHRKAGEITP